MIETWTKENLIDHHFVSPYHHKSAGRVERVNQTLRKDLNKTNGPLKMKLEKVTETYNNKFHRAIGMSPNEALLAENRNKVLMNIEVYKKEFKSKELQQFILGQNVLIKNEVRKSKDQKIFDKQGRIDEILGNDTYRIATNNGKHISRHYSQQKALPGDVVFA